MTRKKNYVNNVDFSAVLDEWIKSGSETPIPDYIAECFLQIVNRYGTKKNFSGYTYIEDMKSEALEHCTRYANRFDTKKSTNAFAYFTQITHNAFIQYINKEKKLSDFKFDLLKESVDNSHRMDYNNISNPNNMKEKNI